MNADVKLNDLLYLARLGCGVFPLTVGSKKPPAKKDGQPGGHLTASADQKAIEQLFKENPSTNWGVVPGPLQVILDLDRKDGKDGIAFLSRWCKARHLDYTAILDSGVVWITCTNDGRQILLTTTKPVQHGTNHLGAKDEKTGVDTRTAKGYGLIPGSVVGGKPYTWHRQDKPLSMPAVLEDAIGAAAATEHPREKPAPIPTDLERVLRRVEHYLLHEADLAIEGQGGDETTYKVAAHCKDLGLDEATTADAMLRLWNDRCSPPWPDDDLRTKVHNAFAYGKYVPGVGAPEADFKPTEPSTGEGDTGVKTVLHPFEEINRTHAYIREGGFIVWETTDEDGHYKIVYLDLANFHHNFDNTTFHAGKKATTVSKAWMEDSIRREYDGLVFAPEQSAGPRWFNLWKGFAVTPAPAYLDSHPALDLWLEHAHDNICQKDEVLYRFLIGFFAHLVQKPWEKPMVALALRGKKGVGKNALVERVGALLEPHFRVVTGTRYTTGNFNKHLENCLFLVLDEAFWAGQKDADGIIQSLITSPHHNIEPKGVDPYRVKNLTRVAIIGNHDWLVNATPDERRYAVFEVGDGRMQDHAFFKSMQEGMEAGGYSVLLRYLKEYNLSGFDVNDAPVTAGTTAQIEHGLDPHAQWWLDCLHAGHIEGDPFPDGEWRKVIEKTALRRAIKQTFQDRNIRREGWSNTKLGIELKRWCPSIDPTSRGSGSGRPPQYALPSLPTARREWEITMNKGRAIKWEN